MYTCTLRVFIIGCPALLQAVSRGAVRRRKEAGSISDGVIGVFYSLIPAAHYFPGVDSASKRNKYQTYLHGGIKEAGA
jgi:hypothetical protein